MSASAPGPARFAAARALPALAGALNHVLDQHPAACERLRMYAGRRVRLGVEPGGGWTLVPDVWLAIDDQGRLVPSEPGDAGVQMLLRPSADAGFDWLRDGVRGISRHLRIEGDVMLAATLADLLQSVRWDAEEDLSRFVGDIAARRIAGGARRVREFVADAGSRLQRQLAGFVDSGDAPLARTDELDALRARTRAAAERLDAIERRFDRQRVRSSDESGSLDSLDSPDPTGMPPA
jgi:ubiquinone biosynthesis protein UbiJ